MIIMIILSLILGYGVTVFMAIFGVHLSMPLVALVIFLAMFLG